MDGLSDRSSILLRSTGTKQNNVVFTWIFINIIRRNVWAPTDSQASDSLAVLFLFNYFIYVGGIIYVSIYLAGYISCVFKYCISGMYKGSSWKYEPICFFDYYLSCRGCSISYYVFVLGNSRNILAELKKTNWIPFVLGLVIVGLEVGFIYAYKAGWKISTAQIVTSSILGVILILLDI